MTTLWELWCVCICICIYICIDRCKYQMKWKPGQICGWHICICICICIFICIYICICICICICIFVLSIEWGAGKAGQTQICWTILWGEECFIYICQMAFVEERNRGARFLRWARPDPGSRPGHTWQWQEESELQIFSFEIIFGFQLAFVYVLVFAFVPTRWAGAGALAGISWAPAWVRLRSGGRRPGAQIFYLKLESDFMPGVQIP